MEDMWISLNYFIGLTYLAFLLDFMVTLICAWYSFDKFIEQKKWFYLSIYNKIQNDIPM